MSHSTDRLRTSATRRKQRERARKRQNGRKKIECWLSPTAQQTIQGFAAKQQLPQNAVASLVLEYATPLYLREISRRLTELHPLLSRIAVFEQYGVTPSKGGVPPIRIHAGKEAVVLDPVEYQQLLDRALPLIQQLTRYGVPNDVITGKSRRNVQVTRGN